MSADQYTFSDQPTPPAPTLESEPTVSLGPTTCHVEDVSQPCQNPSCEDHTATNTPAISRAVSQIDLITLSNAGQYGDRDDRNIGKSVDGGSRPQSENATEQVANAALPEAGDNLSATTLAPPQAASTPSLTPPPPHTHLSLPEGVTPSTTPSPHPEEQQEQQEQHDQQDSINWKFDDPSALQEHLRQEAPERSASFPAIPPLVQTDPDEQSLMNMMATEVATASGGRGMFDSPAVEQGSFFAGTHDSDDFFEQVDQQDGLPTRPMGVNSNAFELQRQDSAQQRYDEGLPLVHDEELIVDSKKEMDFFGSEPDSGDDLFAGMDQVTADAEPVFGGLKRKSTEQVLAGSTHPFHSGEGEAPSKSPGKNQYSTPLPEVKIEEEEEVVAPAVLFTESTPVEDDFFGQLDREQSPAKAQAEAPKDEDVTAKWQAALADDEFLDEDEGFLPSDDEGFLPDDEPEPLVATGVTPVSTTYIPQSQQPQWPGQQLQQPSSYTPQSNAFPPAQTLRHTQSAYFPAPAQSPYTAFSIQRQPLQPEKKPQSFVDKTEGYKSPYDLPMDVIAPPLKRMPNTLNPMQGQAMGLVSPPLRSSSIPPAPGLQASVRHKPAVLPKQQFFEELPMAPPKPRASSAMGRYAPGSMGGPHLARAGSYSPQQLPQGPYAPPPQTQVQPFTQNPQVAPQMVQPARYSPAAQQMGSTGAIAYAPPPTAVTNRYSPAITQGQGYAPPPMALASTPMGGYTSGSAQTLLNQTSPAGKYAPRPAGPPQPTGPAAGVYATPPATATQPQQAYAPPSIPSPMSLPGVLSRPTSGQYSPEQPRRASGEHHALRSSRPGTASGLPPARSSMPPPPSSAGNGRYPLVAPHSRSISTPPPSHKNTGSSPSSVARQLSPHKYSPRSTSGPDAFQPPPRAQTSSPGLHYGRPKIGQKQRDPYERPSSALAHSTLPEDYPYADQQQRSQTALFEPRRESIQLNFMPPNDITAQDELERWQGAPVFTWGFGGVTTMFPVRTQRFASDLHSTVIKCSPGVIQNRQLKDVLSLPEELEKFPGPVWTGSKSSNKTKKRETTVYMDSRIEGFEKTLMDIYDVTERRAAEEKCMLWKIVRIMVEHDGAVEGTPEIDTAVRKVLTPEIAQTVDSQEISGFVPMAGISNMQPANAEAVDSEAMTTFRKKLLSGDREGAVWFAADKRLWAHAMLISSTVGKDLWKRVVEEFVKSEVKTLGEGSESLAVLYATLAGNWEESVDELIPPSARMGMPMLSTSQGQEQSLEDRLRKWRETLALILSNRSPGDQASILALGRLLANYGWVSASHICYIFARQSPLGGGGALFGGPDEPTTDFCLLGANHKAKSELGRDIDSILLSEIYELAVSLAPHASTATPIFPHLQLWKIHHAIILAENGNKMAAQKYCDSVATAGKAWSKPSPYFNPVFYHVLEDLTKRLQEAPRDASSSANASKWIPKLTSDAVSSSMWGAFNKFVSGEEEGQEGANGIQSDGDGLFGKITPGVSRVQSNVDLYGTYGGGGGPMYAPSLTSSGNSPTATRTTTTTSRYAPSTATARSSMESARPNIYEPNRRASSESYRGPPTMNGSAYEPSVNPYEPQVPSYEPSPKPYESPRSAYAPRVSLEATPEVPEKADSPAQGSGYSPPGISNGYQPSPVGSGFEPQNSTGGYEPPSQTGGYEPPNQTGGYEPPSDGFVPYQPEPDVDSADEREGQNKKPKKSFMDDDDDTELLHKAEAVRKAAEEEKRKAAEERAKENGGQKKGWFGGWFGRKDPSDQQQGPIKAKLGEENAFVYDAELKRWVNKKAGGSETPTPTVPTPPPAKRTPPSNNPTPPPARPTPPPLARPTPPNSAGLAPPPGPPRGLTPSPAPSMERPPAAPSPLSRPPTSGGDPMEELMGPPTARRGTPAGGRKGRKGGASRYVEVIPGQQ
ncbi:Sec23-binding domain of Sec16-domain-containing protein [Trichophaea hybrida]|nr:Sec23-binding domain of Sec16-domain-containing protein [Trichophaea hybrida]